MIFTGPRPRVTVPDLTLTAFVLERAQEYGDTLAVTDAAGTRGYTYTQLAAAVRRAAAGLVARGFGPGDVLAMLSPNVPEYPIAFHAAALVGGSVVVLNPLDTPDDLVAHLNASGARLLVTGTAEAPKAVALRVRTAVREVIVFGEAEGTTPFSELVSADAEPPTPAVDPRRDVVTVLHSSGSTGHPKGVLLTHRNMVANVLQTSLIAPLCQGDRVLAVPPFHHAFGLIMSLNAGLRQGATLVTMERFDPESYLRAIQDHRISRLWIVPTIAVLLARSPLVDRFDLSSLRSAVSGGAALDPEVARLVRERTGLRIGQGYGLTEGMVSFMQVEDSSPNGSVGPTAPNVECKIVDTGSGEELGPYRQGEVLVRGPHVMRGYLDAEEATRKVLEPDGFLHTGDLGYMDRDQELFLVDRIKELIKYKGQQVSPVELEAVLMAHPKVADAAVVGIPDEEASELPKGYVVSREPVTAEELMAFVAQRVAPYKKIRRIEFIDRIPRTPVGKVERRTLRERESASDRRRADSSRPISKKN